MIRRRVFAALAYVLLVACLLCVCNVLVVLYHGFDFIYWDSNVGRWLPVPRWRVVAQTWTAAVLAPPLAVVPIMSLRRLIRERRQRNRVWRNRCGLCGYDLRAATGQCPECGTAVPTTPPPSHAGRMAPGTEATLRLVFVPVIVIAVALGLVALMLLLLASDGA